MILNKGVSIEERKKSFNRSKSLNESNKITINLNLEFLDDCEFNCSGCFVRRRNSYTEEDFTNIAHIFNDIDDTFELNEIVLGPTDIFGARNTFDILKNDKFITIFKNFNSLTFNSTLMS